MIITEKEGGKRCFSSHCRTDISSDCTLVEAPSKRSEVRGKGTSRDKKERRGGGNGCFGKIFRVNCFTHGPCDA